MKKGGRDDSPITSITLEPTCLRMTSLHCLQDVVEYVFQQLIKIRDAGYESLVDPLIEDLSAH